MTLPFIKNPRPPAYYGVNYKPAPATWDSHEMWRCTRHIPSSKVYWHFVMECPSCKQPRPPEDQRPQSLLDAPKESTLRVTAAQMSPLFTDPEWVSPSSSSELGGSEPCPKCGQDPLQSTVCHADFLEPLPPAVVTEVSLENMRTLREVNAELNFDKDMSLGQAQRDLDALVVGDLMATADALTETTQEFPEPVVMDSIHTEPSTKPVKPKCPGPGCRKHARETSPYCSKICSDRCLRLRKKAKSGGVLTKTESDNFIRIRRALDNWDAR